MSQHDYILDNAVRASFRSDLNNALAAQAGANYGASAPTTTYANMLWADSSTGRLMMRNTSNTAWIVVGWTSGNLLLPGFSASQKILGRLSAGTGPVEELDCTSSGRYIMALTTPGSQSAAYFSAVNSSLGYVPYRSFVYGTYTGCGPVTLATVTFTVTGAAGWNLTARVAHAVAFSVWLTSGDWEIRSYVNSTEGGRTTWSSSGAGYRSGIVEASIGTNATGHELYSMVRANLSAVSTSYAGSSPYYGIRYGCHMQLTEFAPWNYRLVAQGNASFSLTYGDLTCQTIW